MNTARRLLALLNEAPDLTPYKAELAQILKANSPERALSRALILKLCPACGRCGGGGHYSFNLMTGTTCFGCNGNGCVPPKNAAQWKQTLDRAKDAVNNGTLDKYLTTLDIRAKVKKLWNDWMKIWTSSGVDNYKWQKLSDWENVVLDASYAKSGSRNNTHGSDWTALDVDAIRQCFLADVNGYYSVISDFLSSIGTVSAAIKDKGTPQQINDWFVLVQKAQEYLFNDAAPALHALVQKVPGLASLAKSGKPFQITTNAQGVAAGVWLKDYAPKLLDLRKSKIVTMGNAILPGAFHISKLTWPHDHA